MLVLAAMALVVGAAGAAAAWLLVQLIALVTNLAWFGRLSAAPSQIADAGLGVMTIAVPVIGSLIVGLMARFGSDKIRGHGIPEAIETILYGESKLSLKVAILKPISSAISIGSGGPFGAEGPIIMTGGAIGSLFAQCFSLTAAERKTLLVAGAAAGMTGIFGTPLAAILLAVEVMLFEWKPRSFVPVVAASLSAFAWRPLLLGSGALFPFAGTMPATAPILALAVMLGVVAGLMAVLLSTALYRIEDLFHRLPIHWMWWPALGAVVVGIGGLIDPRVLGAGYGNIQALLDGSLLLRAIVLLLVVKAIVWLVALGSGTSGRRACPAADPGWCARRYRRAVAAGRIGRLGADRHGGGDERGDARAPDRRDLRGRTDRSFRRAARYGGGGGCGLCRRRADHEAIDPDREDLAARPACPAGIWRRSARTGAGRADHDPQAGNAVGRRWRCATRSAFSRSMPATAAIRSSTPGVGRSGSPRARTPCAGVRPISATQRLANSFPTAHCRSCIPKARRARSRA